MTLVKLSTVSDRYLAAYLDALGAKLDAAKQDFAVLAELCALPLFTQLSTNPLIKPEQFKHLLAKLLPLLDLDKITQNLLKVLAENGRFSELPRLVANFPKFVAHKMGLPEIEITTMQALTPAEKEKLTGILKAFYSSDIFIEFETDPRILGGMIVKVGSDMVDTTLRSKLDRMKTTMKGIS